MGKYQKLFDAIEKRFPNAKFTVSCFKTIEEIETKILTEDDKILYADSYIMYDENDKRITAKDYFLVCKREGEKYIYYKDVIDELIKNDFIRNDCDHQYLEKIGETLDKKRNNKSLQVYGSFWGS